MESTYWRKCSSCKKEIPFLAKHYLCSVSTCNQKQTGYVFCSVLCFERHLPGARHKDAAAIEARAPSLEQAQTSAKAAEGTRRIVSGAPSTGSSVPKDILIVASKLKDYIRARADMNTSAEVMEVLSNKVRSLCDQAIEQARRDGRKTVMARDF